MNKTKIIVAACIALASTATQAQPNVDHHPDEGVSPVQRQQTPGATGKPSQTTNQMPEQCRLVMQSMPQECMSLLQNMSATRNMGMVQESMGAGATPATSRTTNLPAHVLENSEAMNKMHAAMAKDSSVPDSDEAFTRAMIPHHQAAIDMARIVLKYGKDQQARTLANDVIREQTREIAQMEEWLKKRAK